ncbi:hypothetical protein TSUD_246440 [Trifolium subterraneum]|uniref:Uncharacterized protein n=1 Tax=Trifolium subterraneum TaxID=3900 RepID=A0A2Z6NLA6_TRISU|nr:hypothetical protein TSUD_246440 [Trifolium subterraneum]
MQEWIRYPPKETTNCWGKNPTENTKANTSEGEQNEPPQLPQNAPRELTTLLSQQKRKIQPPNNTSGCL